MKALMTLLVVLSGLAASAAVQLNTRSNSDCSERKKIGLLESSNPPVKIEARSGVAPSVQRTGGKSKVQGT